MSNDCSDCEYFGGGCNRCEACVDYKLKIRINREQSIITESANNRVL